MSNVGEYLVKELLREIEEEDKQDTVLNENSSMTPGQADDGPIAYFPDTDTYNRISVKRAAKIGWEVVKDDILADLDNKGESTEYPTYPNGPVGAVSYFPAGVVGKKTANKQVEIFSTDAYEKWKQHATRKMALAGYSVIRTLGDDVEEEEAGKSSLSGKDVEKEFEQDLNQNLDEIWNETAGKELNEIPMKALKQVDKFADKQLNPMDIVLTGRHFFDRLQDPRNKKEITSAELVSFFKRLGKNKKEFLDFLKKYNQIVVTDKKTNLNIPFMKKANKAIAKTIMRKANFRTSNVKLQVEDKQDFDRVAFYEQYYKNLTPSEFSLSVENNKIIIEVKDSEKKSK